MTGPVAPGPTAIPVAVASARASGLYPQLMSRAVGEGNDHPFACMIASWQAGAGALPVWLGLSPAAFRRLLAYHFANMGREDLVPCGRSPSAERRDEIAELARLMLNDKAGMSPSEIWMAQVVAAGCMGSDHLWQDLGLWSRQDLTALMRRNFPALAARNDKDMKWKRFLYKQLCAQEGVYSCRAPSCEQCCDYRDCFHA